MAKVERAKLMRQFKKLQQESRAEHDTSVVVGYTAAYAIYVHENLKARHATGKQAKYLEQPFREQAQELARIILEVTAKTGSLKKGLLAAGLRLQRESQKIVPIDTGNLRGSAFTAIEKP